MEKYGELWRKIKLCNGFCGVLVWNVERDGFFRGNQYKIGRNMVKYGVFVVMGEG